MIQINVKADISNLTLTDLYELLQFYYKDKKEVISFKGLKFRIEVNVNMMGLDYVITEIEK